METIRDILTANPLGNSDHEIRRRVVLARLSAYIDGRVRPEWFHVLRRFVESSPWCYWDSTVVEKALEILRATPARTNSALAIRSRNLEIGLDNLFRQPDTTYEKVLDLNKPRDIFRIATEFHPEYLRYAEHIFGNMLSVYWSILRKGGVDGKFSLTNAVALVKSLDRTLVAGYDENVRNAIAHGEVLFRGDKIQYGPEIARYELSSRDFLARSDRISRTVNGLSLALLLYFSWAEAVDSSGSIRLPLSILRLLVGVGVEHPGFRVIGFAESEFPATGKQLHISTETTFRSRTVNLWDCFRLGVRLIDYGALDYERYLFQIDYGNTLSSLIMLSPAKLKGLMDKPASSGSLSEAIEDPLLLWHNEPWWITRVKAWESILASKWNLAREKFFDTMQQSGMFTERGRYRIREVQNRSVLGVGRVHVIAVLRFPADADNPQMMKVIIRSIINTVSKNRVSTSDSGLFGYWRSPGRPKYVWVALYKNDGTLRWLESSGWMDGNLIATAEKIFGWRSAPIYIKNPEELWNGIRFRYSIGR